MWRVGVAGVPIRVTSTACCSNLKLENVCRDSDKSINTSKDPRHVIN